MYWTLNDSWDWLWIQFWENDRLIAPQKLNAPVDLQQNYSQQKIFF